MNTLGFFLSIFRKDLLHEISYPMSFVARLLGIGALCFVYFYLAKMVNTSAPFYQAHFGGDYFTFFVLGMGVYQFAHAGLHAFVRSVRDEAVNGILEALWMGKESLQRLVLSRALWPFANSLASFMSFVIIGGIFFPQLFQRMFLVRLVPAVLLAFFIYVAIGLIAVSFTLTVKRGEALLNLFGSLNFILGGVFFPVSLFPAFLQGVSEFLPLTHLLRLARAPALDSGNLSSFGHEAAFFILFGLGAYALGFIFLRWAIQRVQTEGSLSHA